MGGRLRHRAAIALASVMVLAAAGGPSAAAERPEGPSRGSPKVRPELREQLRRRGAGAVDAIVMLRPGSSRADVQQVAAEEGGQLDGDDAAELIPAFRRSLTARQVERLASDPRVASVSLNGEVRASLDTARRWFGVDAAHAAGYRGGDASPRVTSADSVIAVADSGIDDAHPELTGKVLAFVDCMSGTCVNAAPSDPYGHGTHVAGIAAGAGLDPILRGVAPDAGLVGIRILNESGSGNEFVVVKGIEWAVNRAATLGIDVLNLSLGVSCSSSCDATPMSVAVNRATDAGLPVVVAAGNMGPRRGSVEVPGAARGAITVGAMADVRPGDGEAPNAGFRLAAFSARGPTPDNRVKPDLVAPGVAIRSTCSHDAPWPAGCGSTAESIAMSGTSMATPFVAGTVALLRDAAPTLTPEQIRSLLTTTAVPWGRDESPVSGLQSNDYGAGRLDVAAAVAAVVTADPTPPAVPEHRSATGSLTAAGRSACYEVTADSAYPLTATLLMPGDGGVSDLDLLLRTTTGSLLASSTSASRQQVVTASQPNGAYHLIVEDFSGSSTFDLDVSNATSLTTCLPRIKAFSAVDAGRHGAAARSGYANEDLLVSIEVVNNAATHWMLTSSAVAPTADDPRWRPMSERTWPAPSEGSVLLYPWVRAGNGDISPVADAEPQRVAMTMDITSPSTPSPAVVGGGYLRAREAATVTWPVVTDANLAGSSIAIDILAGTDVITRGAVPNTGESAWQVPDEEIAEPRLRLTATDLAGNQASGSTPTPYIMGLGGYWADAYGAIHRTGRVPPVDEARRWGFRIGRGLAMLPGTEGGYLLDGFGGIHRFAVGGGAVPPRLSGGPYWNGWDIARDLVVLPGGQGGYLLDGFGGIHRLGNAPLVPDSPYFGFDIAKRIVLSPTGRGGYVLDGFGGIHAFRFDGQPAVPAHTSGPYWRGWDISRDLVMRPGTNGTQGYLLDGYGGLHPVGFGAIPPGAIGGPWWNGWDISRGLELLADGSGGYVHDGFGGTHPWRSGPVSPPQLSGTGYQQSDVAVATAFR